MMMTAMHKIHITRSGRRRSVAIQVLPDLSIKVSAPLKTSESMITNMLRQHHDWIVQQQQLMQMRNRERAATGSSNYFYLGAAYPLETRTNQQAIIEFHDKFYLATANTKSAAIYLTGWYKQQARKIITQRVEYYARLAGLSYNTITITEAKTRWGSCSSDRNLFFNWKLVMAPMSVIDYVVAHELAHLVEPNHSRHFWDKVEDIYPLYRAQRTWLKRYGHTLHLPEQSPTDSALDY